MKILIPLLFVLAACKGVSVEKINPLDNYMKLQSLNAQEERGEFLQYLSEIRSEKGLPDLIESDGMNDLAQRHSEEMATGKVTFSNEGSTERCETIANELINVKVCSEIIAKGLNSSEKVLEYWLASASHLGHLLNPKSTHTGVGVSQDEAGAFYWTQIFAEVN